MFLYLVQHVEAVSKEEDPSRSLSDKGIGDIKKIAAFISGMKIEVQQILHSGKIRALQTAQILSDHMPGVNISEMDGLAPMDDPAIWLGRISKLNNNVMLVGHLPHMAKLAGLVLCGGEKNVVNFEMGCVVCLRKTDDGHWALEWILKPGMVK